MPTEAMTGERVRILPTDPRDMVPSAVRWAHSVHAAIHPIPRAQLPAPSRTSLQAVVWVLAAAADFEDCIPADHTAALLAREAGVGDRVRNGASTRLSKRCIIAAGNLAARFLVPDSRGHQGRWSLAR